MGASTAITALIAAGKGFQIVSRYLSKGDVKNAKKIQAKLKGSDKSKSDVLLKKHDMKKETPGSYKSDKPLHIKDAKADEGAKSAVRIQEGVDRKKSLFEKQKSGPQKRPTTKSEQISLEVSEKMTTPRAEQRFRFKEAKKAKAKKEAGESNTVGTYTPRQVGTKRTPAEEAAFSAKESKLMKERQALARRKRKQPKKSLFDKGE